MILPISRSILGATALFLATSILQANDQLALVSRTAQPGGALDPEPSAAIAEPAVPKFELKTKSSFALSTEARAPFWPIGWKRGAAPVDRKASPKPLLDESAFSLSSILLGQPSLAVLNGRAYSEGEFVRLPKQSAGLRVRVHRISDGSVTLQAEDQLIVVAMRRPELTEKKPVIEEFNADK